VIELAAPGRPDRGPTRAARPAGDGPPRVDRESGICVVTRSFLCSLDDSIFERFEAHNCLYQPPTGHRQGWDHDTVIAFDEGDVRDLLRELEADRDIEVLSKTAITEQPVPHSMLAPVDQLFEEVAERHLGALGLALEQGYDEQPRQISLRELADRTAVARSTFE